MARSWNELVPSPLKDIICWSRHRVARTYSIAPDGYLYQGEAHSHFQIGLSSCLTALSHNRDHEKPRLAAGLIGTEQGDHDAGANILSLYRKNSMNYTLKWISGVNSWSVEILEVECTSVPHSIFDYRCSAGHRWSTLGNFPHTVMVQPAVVPTDKFLRLAKNL